MNTHARWLIAPLLFACSTLAQCSQRMISGRVLDPQGNPVAGATVTLTLAETRTALRTITSKTGQFEFSIASNTRCTLRAEAAGFQVVTRSLDSQADGSKIQIGLTRLVAPSESITVSASVNQTTVTSPDPAERVLVRQEMLDANPGRPGAPVSIPGLPIETASGGIKAPQYFVPGVAGDHGEPIGQYIRVGGYLAPNNLSANAHGNGYADPNVLIPQVISGVQVDGGAFNVTEGNHSLNLAAVYALRPQIASYVDITGDYRDLDVVGIFAPTDRSIHGWIALDAAYGNGLLDRLEHRQQYKFNTLRSWQFGPHTLTMFGLGYYGFSFVPGLVPIDVSGLHDTIDPRQKAQTHTAEIAINDV